MVCFRACRTAGLLLLGCAAPLAAHAESGTVEGFAAVSSRVSKDYVRTKSPDGSFQAEGYTLADAGHLNGPIRDASFDRVSFQDVARSLVGPLAAQGYVPAKDVANQRLIILVYWGTTHVPDPFSGSPGYRSYQNAKSSLDHQGNGTANTLNGPAVRATLGAAEQQMAAENMLRNQIDLRNAQLLGYDSEGLVGTDLGALAGHTGVTGALQDELISEVEDTRYFVVLMAYDAQVFLKEKKRVLLWETRFSISEAHNFFDRALPKMAQYASNYFGQDSKGLMRKPVPKGRVEMGEPKQVGTGDPSAK